jgi:hypothetical protein
MLEEKQEVILSKTDILEGEKRNKYIVNFWIGGDE